jgi:hypothetical protein
MSNKKVPKITTPTSREQAIKLSQNLHGLFIEGVFFGTLNDDFAPEITVEWSDSMMGDLLGAMASGGKAEGSDGGSSRLAKTADAFAIGGVRSGKGFGVSAKKVFDKATPFNWNANVTIVDWDGDGLVWDRWERLKQYALPKTMTESALLASGFSAGLATLTSGGTLKAAFANAGKATGASVITSIAGKATGASVITSIAGDLIDEEAMEGAKARSVVSAPDPVHIRIGRYAQTQGASPVASMKVLIQSFGATFSKEMTIAGPMYATFAITFETVEPVTYESYPVGGSRVRIIEGEE